MRKVSGLLVALGALLPAAARAEVPVQRTVTWLPASNGHGALMVDLKTARLTHFREHLFATEEPLLDAQGQETWSGNQPLAVRSRDLLYDAYFGVRRGGQPLLLTPAGCPTTASSWWCA
ncbi:MAG: hypothetical protein EOO75_02460 [Myxococcales bacterium]|nr:MAG: hypothetical protein EOO75_02460 [Myxococcales bacterium]